MTSYTNEQIDAALDVIEQHDPRRAAQVVDALDAASEQGDAAFGAVAQQVLRIAESLGRDAPPPPIPPKKMPLPKPRPQRRGDDALPTHIVTAEQLAQAEPGLRRMLALLLWLFSTAGNLLAFVGGWDAVAWNEQLLFSLVVALVYQAVCTTVQYITCKRWWNPLYLIALAASLIPAFIGYRPLVAVPLTRWAAGIEVDVFASVAVLQTVPQHAILWGLGVHLLVAIGLAAVDIIPERVYVKH